MKKALRETQTLRAGYSKVRTPPARHKHTHRQDRLQYTAPLASAQCKDVVRWSVVRHIFPTADHARAEHSCCWGHGVLYSLVASADETEADSQHRLYQSRPIGMPQLASCCCWCNLCYRLGLVWIWVTSAARRLSWCSLDEDEVFKCLL